MVVQYGTEGAYGQSRYAIISAANGARTPSPEQNNLIVVLQANANEYIKINDLQAWTETGGTTRNFRAIIVGGWPTPGAFIFDDPTEGQSAVPIGKTAVTVTAGTQQNPATAIQLIAGQQGGNVLIGPGQALCVIPTDGTVTNGTMSWFATNGVSFPTVDARLFDA